MATQYPLLAQASVNGYGAGTPYGAANPLATLTSGSPLVGGSTPLAATPRRPSIPAASSSTSAAHQQALLLRHQQAGRGGSFSGPAGSSSFSSSSTFHVEDGAPPHKYPVHRAYTRLTDTEPGEPFPSLSPAEQARVQGWIERDIQYEGEVGAAKKDRLQMAGEMLEELVMEQDWLGPLEPQPKGKFRLRWPQEKTAEELKGKRGPLRTPVPMSKVQLRAIASQSEHLIPIRIDLEHEVYRLRDTFTWNLRETLITPKQFCEHLLADLRLPKEPFLRQMIASFEKQIADAQLSAQYEAYLDSSVKESEEESRRWFEEKARKRRRLGKGKERGEWEVTEEELFGSDEAEKMELEAQGGAGAESELRVLIKLDITLDTIQLVDKFEWDISNPHNSPEEFAETFSTELGLTGEFATAIAHSIREQVDLFTRSLCILNYSRTGLITDDDLRKDFQPPLLEPFRTDLAGDFTPLLTQLTRDEVDRLEKEHDRENRRKRRQTKGRGITLPDREAARTNRTLVPRSQKDLVSFETDFKGHKTYHLPELNESYAIVGKPVPPKPADLDTNEANPLKLLLSKDRAGAAGGEGGGGGAVAASGRPLVGAAAANRARKEAAAAAAAAGGGGGAGESPVKGGAGGTRKKPPVIKPSAEELGLHEHIIDGQWFCANCGVPGRLAVGRRKGPTGKDSLCGTCGKHFHRYKRQRPCEYTREFDTHMRLRTEQDAVKGKSSKSKKGGVEAIAAEETRSARTSGRGTPASQAMSPASSHDDSDDSEAVGPSRKRRGNYYGSPDTPFVNLDSDDSNDDESLAEPSPAVQTRRLPSPLPPPAAVPPKAPATGASAASAASSSVPQPLPWMVAAAAELRAKQVDDRFEIIPRPRPADAAVQEWRIRCLDCPGKLYNLGPGETLDGFLVHFKNRVHRGNVEARLAKERGQ
ncbi:hypothetical protein JCM8547_009352 [Rhodosporidiobolus lusitaniae]